MGHLDVELSEAVASLRFGAATWLFVVASAWWVKAPLFLAIAGARDVAARRRVPLTLLAVGIAAGLSSAAANGLKTVFDRPRPPLGDDPVTALTALPSTASFPSGHAATAFGAAVALGLLVPRLRIPALAIAGLVAFSRVYLGVHYTSDVIAGGLLGAAIAAAVVYASSGFSGRSRARDSAPASPGRGSGLGVPG
jgi:undecaprenyl-diphosphatase